MMMMMEKLPNCPCKNPSVLFLFPFDEIKFLKIELPIGELGIEDDVLFKWRAGGFRIYT
ncbi:hypothetical protein Hdeb2414_s0001g00022051 [Helianthus debilis subsp. tardiflorus]